MKKILSLVLVLALAVCASLALAEEEAAPVNPMTKEEFDLAEIDAPVCVEAYVQASQGWFERDGAGRMTIYLQNEEGGFFAYELPMDEEASKQLVPGTKIRVEGFKSMWPEVDGEVEIIDGTYEVLDAEPWIAEAEDVTGMLGTDKLVDHMNEKIAIKGAKVVASTVNGAGEYAFLYNWDGSGDRNDPKTDLYFNVEVNGATYTLTVESYLCNNETDVYKAVEALQIGDVIDLEGFLYWYNGANPHITAVTAAQ